MIDNYPFRLNPHWSPAAIGQAMRALEKIPAEERLVVAELVDRARDDVQLGVSIAEKVARAPSRERGKFFRLIRSDDEHERSRARTWAASREPMPDPRLAIYRKIIMDAEASMRRFPGGAEEECVCEGIAAFRRAVESIKARNQPADW
jgi:hypothetical protein